MLVHSSRHDAYSHQAQDSPSSSKTAPSPKISQARSLFYLFYLFTFKKAFTFKNCL